MNLVIYSSANVNQKQNLAFYKWLCIYMLVYI